VCAALSLGGEGVAYRHLASDVGSQLCLNQDGTSKAQRVLACVAYTYPEVQLCVTFDCLYNGAGGCVVCSHALPTRAQAHTHTHTHTHS
jgi:hypothetical protein